MNTKLILTTCAIFLGLIGLVLSFLPREILAYLTIQPSETLVILMQLLGALYLGFGMMNWMVKGSIIGGIYNKPIVIGNLMHFGVGAITLLKIVFSIEQNVKAMVMLAIIYTIFAFAFGFIFMVNPTKLKE